MNQEYVRTSLKQRIIIAVVAFLMLSATVATYVLIILNNKNGEVANVTTTSSLSAEDQALLEELQTKMAAKQDEATDRAKALSSQYFDTFKGYMSRVRAFNATTANNERLKTEDLKKGTGRTLTEGDLNYMAYYIGYCANEEVFDSSFDNFEKPTRLTAPISASAGLIEGWNAGVVGMKIGGVREITMAGELAYGDQREICGGTNSPLRFVVMAVEDAQMDKINQEITDIQSELIGLYTKK